MLYWFVIWREYKLCTAEILSVFPQAEIFYNSKNIVITKWIKKEEILSKSLNMWWIIKVFEVKEGSKQKDIEKYLINIWKTHKSKFNYSINTFPQDWKEISKLLTSTKKELKKENISCRFVNKNNQNLSSATIISNKLIEKGFDLNIANINWKYFFWKTIWIQDINSYSKRDYSKSRDMQIWMLPPKLSQIMINLSRNINKDKEINSLYDPFVWLWTVLIEAKGMWIKNIYWSDTNEKMVIASKKNSNAIIEKLNAKFVSEFSYFEEIKKWVIVTEWFLWEIMTKKNISIDRIEKNKKSLEKIYLSFFESLKKWWFGWHIVISFPFWDLDWKYIFFEEIYKILDKYCHVLSFFPESFNIKESKYWSLFYKRQKQFVWREIFKLKMK